MSVGRAICSALCIQHASNLRILLRDRIPEVSAIVDARVVTASDAAEAMELGADGIRMNTAYRRAQTAVLYAELFVTQLSPGGSYLPSHAERLYASASSPTGRRST